MATLVGESDYPTVRAALDVTVDETVLPDAVITMPIYLDASDDEVKRRDPMWASRDEANRKRLVNAAILLLASRVAPAIPDITREQLGQFESYDRKAVDWPKRAAELRSDADALIAYVLSGGTKVSTMPTFFDVASGRRGY